MESYKFPMETSIRRKWGIFVSFLGGRIAIDFWLNFILLTSLAFLICLRSKIARVGRVSYRRLRRFV